MASSRKMNVVLLALEWGSKSVGLPTFNKELAIQLAKHPDVHVSLLVPRCDKKEINAAQRNNVTLFQATSRPGYDETYWLCFPPDDVQIDFVIGQGVILGRQAQLIKGTQQCKWIQFVLTEPEDLGLFQKKEHGLEIELCELADFVVTVGPKLKNSYRSYLRCYKKDQKVFLLTPGIFSQRQEEVLDKKKTETRKRDKKKTETKRKHSEEDRDKRCKVLAVGRGDSDDFSFKGLDIAAKAVRLLNYVDLIVAGAQTERHNELKIRFQEECGMPRDRLKMWNSITETRGLLSDVDLVIMPSITEDFGLVALEALSAGLPVLVSAYTGFGQALGKITFGSLCVVHSEDPCDWNTKIKMFWEKERDVRLEEFEAVRDSYAKEYSWEEQCKNFVQEMRIMLDGRMVAVHLCAYMHACSTELSK